jgi:hypothetical protein
MKPSIVNETNLRVDLVFSKCKHSSTETATIGLICNGAKLQE